MEEQSPQLTPIAVYPSHQQMGICSVGNAIKRSIARLSSYVDKHLVRSFFVVFIVFTLINAFVFYYVDDNKAFNNKKTDKTGAFVDGLYFTITTISTVGFGDICPQKNWSKIYTVFMQLTTLFLGAHLFETTSKLQYI